MTETLEEYLNPLIGSPWNNSITKQTSEREIEIDPSFESLISVATEINPDYTDRDDFISKALLQSIGVDSNKSEIIVPDYDQYEFVVKQLVESSDNNLHIERDILETAMIESLSI